MKNKINLTYFLASIIYVTLIFYMSSRSISSLNFQGRRFLQNFAHIPIYLGLTYVIGKSFTSRFRLFNHAVFFIVVVIAFLDEFLQSFAKGRTVAFMDIGLDLIGVII